MRRNSYESSTLNFQFLLGILGIRVQIPRELHHKNKIQGQWSLGKEREAFFTIFLYFCSKLVNNGAKFTIIYIAIVNLPVGYKRNFKWK